MCLMVIAHREPKGLEFMKLEFTRISFFYWVNYYYL